MYSGPRAARIGVVASRTPYPSDGFTFMLRSLAFCEHIARLPQVVWRGHLKERHSATSLVQRVPVYRLADG
jgi:hypothetical protein